MELNTLIRDPWKDTQVETFAHFETDHANRYLTALCNHFARRVEVHREAEEGWVKFSFGRCDMTADHTGLTLQATAADQELLEQLVQILTSHLERYAFRENPTLLWQVKST